MFEAIAKPARRRSRAATGLSLAAHALGIGIAVVVGLHAIPPPPPPEVSLAPPRFGPSKPTGRNPSPQPSRPEDRKPAEARAPRLRPSHGASPTTELPRESTPDLVDDTATPAGADPQGTGGPDTQPAGLASAAPSQSGPLEYEAGTMTPPRQISGPDPEYTMQALQNDVQGLMVVKCIVTAEGAVHRCRVLQGLPFMDRAVVEALERRRYAPARLADGRAVEVDYTFRIRLQLPQ